MSKPDEDEGGFFSRWSRRKAQVHQGEPVPAQAPPAAAVVAGPASAAQESVAAPPSSTAIGAGTSEAVPVPKPTLQDVEQLDAKSDYRSFVAPDVDPEVRNAAFKKLFHSDPHFNVMDGLDVYIDDYNTPNPLPVAIMKTLVQARAMGLIDDELKEQDPPSSDGDPSHQGEPALEAESADTGDQPDQPLEAPAPSGSEPELVEVKLVPDQASNDEPVSAASSTESIAAGTVVPFPRRPGTADPA